MNRLADREEATIVLVIDVSGSMQAKDVKPTRLAAAQKVVRDFMKRLPERFQVGVVSFSETAEVAAPATADRQLAIDAIDYLYPQRGTAIGDGLARGVEVARAAEAGRTGQKRPAAILLLSDGSQTEGVLLPQEGAARAKSFKIPVYTIALGTPEGVVEFNRFGASRIIPVPPDKPTLRQIAAMTGGRFYEAESVGDLREAYEQAGIAREQGEAQAGSHVRVSRRRTRPPARRGRDRGRDVPEAAVRLSFRPARGGGARGLQRRREGGRMTSNAAQTVTVTEPSSTETTTAPSPNRAGSLSDAVARVLPSVVNVRTESFGGGRGEGSGIVLDRRGIILTNNHVVEGTTRVTVVFNDDVHKRPMAGTVIGTAPEKDLAVIRVRATDLVPLPLARSSALRLGDAVFAVGFPLGLGATVTSGIISGLHRTIDGQNGKLTGLLQTDAAINPGNSGGPLVDRSGRLLGINTAGVRLAEAENVSFAIAIDEALPVIAKIRKAPPDSEAWLGIAYSSVDSESAAVQLGLDGTVRGAAVTVVYPGGPAEKADLAVGDVVIAADDVPVDSASDLSAVIASRDPGDELDLEVIDTAGPRLVTVVVAKRAPGALP